MADDFKPTPKSESVRVVIRCRPLSSTEKKNRNGSVVDMDRDLGQVIVRNPSPKVASEPPRTWSYDGVFPPGTEQQQLYEETARPIVDSVMQGYNGTIFAYGQTGTGKTFTMEGEPANRQLAGVIPRACSHIFEKIEATVEVQFLVQVTFLEIYRDDVFDLLPEKRNLPRDRQPKLEVKEHPETGIYVKDLNKHMVGGVDEMLRLLRRGQKHRATGQTKMNDRSSRSHCIFSITVERSEMGEDGQAHIRRGKLNMVDLAGSERQSKTGASGVRLKEATKINLSLSALGNVIHALTSAKHSHIPYRDSKLTRLLQDSLGGNTKTVMVANIGPADYNYDETVNTLRFASRAKQIENKPTINEDPKDAMLREFQEEIERLKAQLEQAGAPGGDVYTGDGGSASPMPEQEVIKVTKYKKKIVKTGVTEEQLRQAELEAEEDMRRFQQAQEEEKQRMREQAEESAARAQAMREELEQRENALHLQRQNVEEMQKKLGTLQDKLVMGEKIVSEAERQERVLEQKRIQVQQEKLELERKQRLLRQRENDKKMMMEQHATQDDKLESKNQHIKKMRAKYHEIKQEVEDLQAEHQREREEMLETIRELTREIQLKEVIIDNFVPPFERRKLEQRSSWDDDQQDWVLSPMNLQAANEQVRRPGSVKPNEVRPISDVERLAIAFGHDAAQYRMDCILQQQLDVPPRTTRDLGPLEEEEEEQYGYEEEADYGHPDPEELYYDEYTAGGVPAGYGGGAGGGQGYY